jgi:hypothetical protein
MLLFYCNMLNIILSALYIIAIVFTIAGLLYILIAHIVVLAWAALGKLKEG